MPAANASLTVRKTLPCRPEVAFRAWTEPALFQQWFSPNPAMQTLAEVDLRLGGKYRITFVMPEGKDPVQVVGEFLLIDAPSRLEYTWIWESNPEWKDRSIVKIAFNPLERDRTEVILTHEHFSDLEDRDSHNDGWTRILDRMALALAIP